VIPSSPRPDRRAVLWGLGAALAGGLTACGPDTPTDTDRPAPADPEPDGCLPPDEVRVPLSDHPDLETRGWTVVTVPDRFLDVIVAAHAGGLVALWRVCTHGACPLSWDPDAGEAWCGCHGGRFAADGTVVAGPPPRPARTFPVWVEGDELVICRPG
jgi:cytochrome b6-f complex iron-sulfur subunit